MNQSIIAVELQFFHCLNYVSSLKYAKSWECFSWNAIPKTKKDLIANTYS